MPELVLFYDVGTQQVVRIPAVELRPGVVQARVQGIDEVVWIAADQLKQGEVKHPPFAEEVRVYVRQIQTAFSEQRPLSFEEWEDGFRRDAHPEQEIALWSHAAEVYQAFADEEPSADRRREIYGVIIACLTSSPKGVWNVLRIEALSRPEAERVVARFYGKQS